MFELTDCPSCGGLLPQGQRCCPHCHCRYPALKRWWLLAAAALGLGGAGCHHNAPVVEYGPAMIRDLTAPTPMDAAVDAAPHDAGTD